MQTLFSTILASLLLLSPSVYASHHHQSDCYSERALASRCPNECCPEYAPTPFQVDNACVDFCLDYKHSLSECQKGCWN